MTAAVPAEDVRDERFPVERPELRLVGRPVETSDDEHGEHIILGYN